MADPIIVKVSVLPELTDLAVGDLITAVDISESIAVNKTKKLQAGNLKIFDGTQITDNIINAAKLTVDSVETAKIKNLNVTTDKLADNSVAAEKLRDSAALSVIGNGTNALADPTDIVAVTDGHVLRRSGTALAFGQVSTAGIADNAITESKLGTIKRTVIIRVLGPTDTVATGSYGKLLPVPVSLNGFVVVDIRMNVSEPSTAPTIANVKVAGGVCSTLTVAANQTGMNASGTISGTYKTFYTNNFVEVDVTTGSSATGLTVTLVLEGNPT